MFPDERRHKQSLNHSVSYQITMRFPNALLGMEDLSNVRERTNRKHSKKASKKQRKADGNQSKWLLLNFKDMSLTRLY